MPAGARLKGGTLKLETYESMLKNNENVLGESLPIVSIIIPVYNVGIYLEKCISSCLEQTYKRCEIILVDDGCTD